MGALSVFSMADYQPVPGDFWLEDTSGKELKIVLNRDKFLKFLQGNGFHKYYRPNNDFIYVRVLDHIVDPVEIPQIKDFVIEYARNLDYMNADLLAETLLRGSNHYFSEGFLAFLEPVKLKFKEDTAKETYIYFQNSIVRVSADGIEEIGYETLKLYIWRKQIIPRDYVPADHSECDFDRFIKNITGYSKNPDRGAAITSALGYLINRHKDPSRAKVIVLMDEQMSDDGDEAQGGTGKSLVIKALAMLRNIVTEPGSLFDIGQRFALSNVDLDTDIFALDDISRKFDFKRMFPLITGDWSIDDKHVKRFVIPFHDAPKIAITTNYTIPQTEASYLRRLFEIELTEHYNKDFTPRDDFGRILFDDWDAVEWQRFDNFMLHCVWNYHVNGLIPYNEHNILKRKLIDSTSRDFIEFAEMNLAKEDGTPDYGRYETSGLYESFLETNPTYKRWLRIHTFAKWCRLWVEHNGAFYQTKQERAGGVRCSFLHISENPNFDSQEIKWLSTSTYTKIQSGLPFAVDKFPDLKNKQ